MTTAFRNRELESMLLANGYAPGPILVPDTGDGHTGVVFYTNNEFRP